MWEQLTGVFECSDMYALCKMSYLHKPLRLSEFSILLCNEVECDTASMSIIIYLVCLNIVSVGVIFSLGGWVTLICVRFIFQSVFAGNQAYISG